MRTLFAALRVTDLDAALAFHTTLGYDVVGRVDAGDARLVMLAFPGEEEVTLELVHRPGAGAVDPAGCDHLAVQVDDLAATRQRLLDAGLAPSEIEHPGGPDGPRTVMLTDPDGYRIELVQWPDGHPTGMARADFAGQEGAR